MKSDYDYQLPWRPNFEIRAIGGWLFGAGLAYLAARWSGLPMAPFLGLIIFCGTMAAWRLPATVGVW